MALDTVPPRLQISRTVGYFSHRRSGDGWRNAWLVSSYNHGKVECSQRSQRSPVYYSSACNDGAKDNLSESSGSPYNFPRLPLLPISAIVVCPSLHFAPKVILGRILRILICQILVNCAPFIASVVSGSRSAKLLGWVLPWVLRISKYTCCF